MQWIYWLLAIIISSGAGYWVYRADKRRAVPYPWATSLLRTLVVFFTLLLLLVPVPHIHNFDGLLLSTVIPVMEIELSGVFVAHVLPPFVVTYKSEL